MTKEEEDILYLNNYKKKTFQWELWAYCNSNCTFCYLGEENHQTQIERQLQSLKDLKKALENFDFNTYNNISLIGGEFFQGQLRTPEIKSLFYEILYKIGELYKEKKIGSCWLTVTLTIGEQKELYDLLDYYEQNNMFRPVNGYGSSGLWLCTSWDAKGRFHTDKMKQNWEQHVLNIHKKYPWIKWTTTMILTGPLMRDIVNDKLDLYEFSEKFGTTLFFKQPGIGTNFSPHIYGYNFESGDSKEYGKYHLKSKQEMNKALGFDFFPSVKLTEKFLDKMNKDYFVFIDRLFNIQYRADELHRNFNDAEHDRKDERYKNTENETSEETNVLNTCGHLYNYACFEEDNSCIMCMKKKMLEDKKYEEEIIITKFKKDNYLLNKIRQDCKIIIKDMPTKDKIKFIKFLLERSSNIINLSMIINLCFLLKTPNIDVFNSKHCWFKDILEYADIISALNKEINIFKTNFIKCYIGNIMNKACYNKEQNPTLFTFWKVAIKILKEDISSILLNYKGNLKITDIQPVQGGDDE